MATDDPSPADDRAAPTAADWIAQGESFITRRGHRIAYRRRGDGPTVLLLHGFPTWSYDYAEVAEDLARDHDVVTLDFLGYGASDKPNPHDYSVHGSADVVEELAAHLHLEPVNLVVHDYGGIVGQELIDRALAGRLGFAIGDLVVLNCGIVYSAYRPTRLQRLLALPILGRLLTSRITAERVRAGLDAIRRPRLTDAEFENLWLGISRENGHRLAHLLINYNAERAIHHQRWESALTRWDGPVHLVWGTSDPVSGRHVLEPALARLPNARVTELDGIGHFPQSEAPRAVAAAVRSRP
ncbi:alpha/beta hydrolase [Mycolicibacterium sp. 050158]|uniref:alpha/beta fold hydrolase n=1 Tax=Mycolicibacterium sp. 050158 TaxID=3090602 RepID=UPI00299DC7FA|nr:alpha/beta hydrolase [Mycolicibacterium sp. 050158]MDX1891740.1 alpha/beta hydrolase [Mycolicibacterium sp. 050158]